MSKFHYGEKKYPPLPWRHEIRRRRLEARWRRPEDAAAASSGRIFGFFFLSDLFLLIFPTKRLSCRSVALPKRESQDYLCISGIKLSPSSPWRTEPRDSWSLSLLSPLSIPSLARERGCGRLPVLHEKVKLRDVQKSVLKFVEKGMSRDEKSEKENRGRRTKPLIQQQQRR